MNRATRKRDLKLTLEDHLRMTLEIYEIERLLGNVQRTVFPVAYANSLSVKALRKSVRNLEELREAMKVRANYDLNGIQHGAIFSLYRCGSDKEAAVLAEMLKELEAAK